MSDCCRLIVRLGGTIVWLILAVRVGAQPEEDAGPPKTPMAQLVNELIRAELPPFVAPLPPEVEEFFPQAAAGEVKDGTLYLPTMTVRQQMKAPLQSTDWLTAHGRMELALKRFPGTRIGNFFGTNDPWARARLAEDIGAERHAALKERGRRVLVGTDSEVQADKEVLAAALAHSGRPPSK